MQTLLRFILFQIAWFSCAILAGGDYCSWAWIPMCAFGFGYVLISSTQRKVDTFMMMGSSIIGFCFDSLLIVGGVFSTPALDLFSPFWLVSMWTGFATAFSMGLYEIRKINWFLIVVVAAIGGLFSYRAGASFGGIILHEDIYFSSIGIMLEWSVAFPMLLVMYDKITRYVNEK
jgi:hypothetical protein